MKTFIRVENEAGEGMFTASNNVYGFPELNDLAERHYKFPNRWNDTKIANFLSEDREDVYRFAFKNLSQFEEWVLRVEVQLLKDAGFRVVKVVATDYFESEFQAVFNILSVESQEDITELFLN